MSNMFFVLRIPFNGMKCGVFCGCFLEAAVCSMNSSFELRGYLVGSCLYLIDGLLFLPIVIAFMMSIQFSSRK